MGHTNKKTTPKEIIKRKSMWKNVFMLSYGIVANNFKFNNE